jgi:quercetin dioxygenase-like cupin family protein
MQHVRRDAALRQPVAGDLFIGEVSTQALSSNDQFRVQEVAFAPGARTKWHTHTFHQVLVITEGEGVVATEEQETHVRPGDVLHVSPGTRHWHGADANTAMAHLSVNGPGDTSW